MKAPCNGQFTFARALESCVCQVVGLWGWWAPKLSLTSSALTMTDLSMGVWEAPGRAVKVLRVPRRHVILAQLDVGRPEDQPEADPLRWQRESA